MNLTEKIIALRNEKRLKPVDMANALDMAPSNYVRFEKKDKDFTINQLEKVAAVLEVTLEELLHYGEPANSGVDVGALEIEIKELKRELDLLKKELAVTQKDLSLTKQQTAKKYNGKFLKVTDKDIGLFIKEGFFIDYYREQFFLKHPNPRFVVPALSELLAEFVVHLRMENIHGLKEYSLYLYFTYLFFDDCLMTFFSPKESNPFIDNSSINLVGAGDWSGIIFNFPPTTYLNMSKDEVVKLYSYCYTTHLENFFEQFVRTTTIDVFLTSGLLNLDGFVQKWRYATSKSTFFRTINDYILGIISKQQKFTWEELAKYQYFDND